MRDTVVGYDGCFVEDQDVKLKRGKVHYALLPVWMLTTKWKDKDYLFAMNGQTGKLGRRPADELGKVLGDVRASSPVC